MTQFHQAWRSTFDRAAKCHHWPCQFTSHLGTVRPPNSYGSCWGWGGAGGRSALPLGPVLSHVGDPYSKPLHLGSPCPWIRGSPERVCNIWHEPVLTFPLRTLSSAFKCLYWSSLPWGEAWALHTGAGITTQGEGKCQLKKTQLPSVCVTHCGWGVRCQPHRISPISGKYRETGHKAEVRRNFSKGKN